MTKPLCIDLFCGLGGWTEGFLAEGWDVVGFDIERHRYPKVIRQETAEKLPGNNGGAGSKIWAKRPVARLNDANDGLPIVENEWMEYPAQLVLQDALTIHGKQFKTADCIVASPPCQTYSYMAMPWSRAKAIAAEYRSGKRDVKKLTALFDACFRIQREAIEAAGHFIPLVVENVRGAQPWVGRSRWNFGSFHLWGDVPALMPMTKAVKVPTMGAGWYPPDHPKHVPGLAFNTHAERHIKNNGGSWFNIGSPGQKETNRNPIHDLVGQKTIGHVNKRDGHWHTRHLANQAESDGVKQHKSGRAWFADPDTISGSTNRKSSARKAASAAIARIPFALSQHIARAWKPVQAAA